MTKSLTSVLAIFLLFSFWQPAISAPTLFQVEVAVDGDGVVTSEPSGIFCCEDYYKKNTQLILTATPNPDSSFISWGGDCSGTELTCAIKVSSTMKITATFDTVTVSYPAPVLKTGQTECYDDNGTVISCEGTGQDADYQAGAPLTTDPRFTDNQDGAYTDNATGLIWLDPHSAAECHTVFEDQIGNETGEGPSWEDNLAWASQIADGQCGLTDGSVAGDWRIPNVHELLSLIDFSSTATANQRLPEGNPFGYLPEQAYLTSTSIPGYPAAAWMVRFGDYAVIEDAYKVYPYAKPWPVKGGLLP